MNAMTTHTSGVTEMLSSYENTAKNIALILRRRHKLTAAQAQEAIQISPLQSIYQSDPEMASHTSNEAWAREVFLYWKRAKKN